MEKLSETFKLDIPKGAGPQVDEKLVKFVETYGQERLAEAVKMNFKNVKRLLGDG